MKPESRIYNVLVVDDEPSVCQSVDKVLRRRGYHVEQALSVAQAVEMLERSAAFDLVLADLMMPQVGGLELIRIASERWPGLPVVVITGYASIATAVEATKLGAVDYLPKPFTPDELMQTAMRALGGREPTQMAPRGGTPAKASGQTIDVDLPFDEGELEAATSASYVAHLTRSDLVVVDVCDLGRRPCQRLKTRGVCRTGVCPVVTTPRRAAQPAPVSARIDDPIDVDMPFSAAEVAAATSPAFAESLGRGDMPNLGRWPRGRKAAPRILAVDDEAVVVRSIRKALSRKGFVVDEAFSGHAAMRQVVQHPYDLVLLDMRMPDTNGLDLLPKIKKQQPGVPVIVVTGFASIDTAVEAIQRGAADYVPKPFTPDELASVAAKVLQQAAV